MITFLQLAGGLFLLYLGGELLVRGAVSLARRLGVSPLIVGLTVVSAGTSAPELVVSLVASLEGAPGIAVGNVVGSNIANILLVMGATALIYPVARNAPSLRRDGSVFILTAVLMTVLCMSGVIERWNGIIMVFLLIVYVAGSYWIDRRDVETAREIENEVAELAGDNPPMLITLGQLVFGLVGVIGGAELTVGGAVELARAAGIDETVIGLTLVAVGTSLPELAASVIAARRRHTDVALGNAIGSCIFNVLAIMGTVAIVKPVPVPTIVLGFDIWVMLSVSLGFVAVALALPRLGKSVGVLFLLLYAAYVWAQFSGYSQMMQTLAK